MGSRRYLTLGIALAALVVLAYGLWAPSGREVPPPGSPADTRPPGGDTDVPRQQVEQFRLTLTASPQEVWHLRAPRADRSAEAVRLTRPEVVLQQEGETTAILSATRGVYRFDERYLEMTGEVVLRRVRQGQVLRTNFLSWSFENGILKTHARVRLEMPRGVLTARGLMANLSEERLQFLSEVEFLSHSSSR